MTQMESVDAKSGHTLECTRTHSKIIKMINRSLPVPTGQTGYGDRSDRFHRERREDLKPRAWEGPHRNSWIYGCSEVGRPLRTSANAVETSEEQHMGLEKLGFGEEDKK